MIDPGEILYRASEYCRRQGSELGSRLGHGYHGSVFSVDRQSRSRQSAIKVHEREQDYVRERDGYFRLQSHHVTSILEFDIPELLGYEDELFAIEMTIVTPPFVLDFAGAYLDREPDFSEEVWTDEMAKRAELFGENLAKMQAIPRALEQFGVFLADVHPGNIRFRD